RLTPPGAAVVAALHQDHAPGARPGDTVHHVSRRGHGHPFGWIEDQRSDVHRAHRAIVDYVAFDLEVAAKWGAADVDAGEPLDRSHSVPARHQQPEWRPVVAGEWRAVHRVDDEN